MGKDLPSPTYDVPLEGNIIGVRTVQDRGRVQIPKKAREILNISDGDSVFWIKVNNKIIVMKATPMLVK